jgi:short-subunit dehydrogenase
MKAEEILSKTILFTGYSSGIGKELEIYLRRAGKDVYSTARSKADLKELHSNGIRSLVPGLEQFEPYQERCNIYTS